MRRKSVIAVIALPALLAACTAVPKAASPNRPVTSAPRASVPATDPALPSAGFIPPTVMQAAGLEGLIGQRASGVERLLGTPRLRTLEGDALKLQFAGKPCVLDVYLYPLRPGAEPVATHVEARRASDAEDVDRVACVTALKR